MLKWKTVMVAHVGMDCFWLLLFEYSKDEHKMMMHSDPVVILKILKLLYHDIINCINYYCIMTLLIVLIIIVTWIIPKLLFKFEWAIWNWTLPCNNNQCFLNSFHSSSLNVRIPSSALKNILDLWTIEMLMFYCQIWNISYFRAEYLLLCILSLAVIETATLLWIAKSS